MRIPHLITAIAILSFAVTAGAQRRGGGSVTFAVVVTDPAGAPISNALVTLQGAAERSGRTERGRLAFENVPAGTYRLRFEREAFITLERELVARGAKPIEIKVTLTPAPPVKPVPCVEPAAPTPAAGSVVDPVSLDLTAFIEKNYVGRDPSKISAIACTPGGAASLIQLREPMTEQRHADADEFLYVVAGTGALRIGDRVDPLQSGVLALVPRTVPHALTVKGRNPLIVLSIRAGEKCGGAPK